MSWYNNLTKLSWEPKDYNTFDKRMSRSIPIRQWMIFEGEGSKWNIWKSLYEDETHEIVDFLRSKRYGYINNPFPLITITTEVTYATPEDIEKEEGASGKPLTKLPRE